MHRKRPSLPRLTLKKDVRECSPENLSRWWEEGLGTSSLYESPVLTVQPNLFDSEATITYYARRRARRKLSA